MIMYYATLVGYVIVAIPVFCSTHKDEVMDKKLFSKRAGDFIRNTQLLINLATSLGQLVLLHKKTLSLAATTTLVAELFEQFDSQKKIHSSGLHILPVPFFFPLSSISSPRIPSPLIPSPLLSSLPLSSLPLSSLPLSSLLLSSLPLSSLLLSFLPLSSLLLSSLPLSSLLPLLFFSLLLFHVPLSAVCANLSNFPFDFLSP